MIIRVYRTLLTLAGMGFCWLQNSPGYGQPVAEEKIAPIDWERATSDAERSASIAPALNAFRENNAAELTSIKLPVLVPNATTVQATPRIRGQGDLYVVAYTLPAAKLSILGTSVFFIRPDEQNYTQSAPGHRVFDRSDDGSDLSFQKYGASYVLRLSCAKPEDERCAKERFLNTIADSLLVVGDPTILLIRPAIWSPTAEGADTTLTVYFPNIRFPLEQGPAYLNSQVYRPGGMHGGGGGQCDNVNYSYPWRDNFCEERSWVVAFCPAGRGHQGQDIRPSSCRKDMYWAVAVEDGVIANVGTYSVTLQTANGVLYRYLHLNMDELAVEELDRVNKSAKIGKVSNYFGTASTTIYLHFDVKGAVRVGDSRVVSYLPPYTSLVRSYKRLMQEP